MPSLHGTPTITFLDLVRDTIQTRGLRWAVEYYSQRLPAWQARFFIRQAAGI